MVGNIAEGGKQILRQLMLHFQIPVVDRGRPPCGGDNVGTRKIRPVVVSGIFIRWWCEGRHATVDLEGWVETVVAWSIWIRGIACNRPAAEIVIHQRSVEDSTTPADDSLPGQEFGRPPKSYPGAEVL